MSFKKARHPVPIREARRHRRRRHLEQKKQTNLLLAGATAVGMVAGLGSVAASGVDLSGIAAASKAVAVSTGISRAREPEAGDRWSSCNNARAAGTTPIFEGEPGYREEMDGDSDGVACEPYRR